ncbi:MAG TPA: hemolysin family protein, partial [bacterium]|nr:hemolysin family protein [bacterium]
MINLFVILMMLAANALFAAYELALTSTPHNKLLIAQQHRKKNATAALFMKENIEATLSIIQLGITFCGIISGAVGGAGPADALQGFFTVNLGFPESVARLLAMFFTVVPIGGFTIIFAELIPKVYALRHNIAISLALSGWMKRYYDLFHPAATFFEKTVARLVRIIDRLLGRNLKGTNGATQLSIKELRTFASLSRKSKLISSQEERIIIAATKLSSRPIREIMIPLQHTISLSLDKSLQQNIFDAHHEAHKRYPVLEKENNFSTCIGYVTTRELTFYLKKNPAAKNFRAVIRPLPQIPYNVSIAMVLEKMIEDKMHLIMLKDTANKPVGIVTLEEIIEELVGDIQNEYDLLPAYVYKRADHWIAGGGTTLK